MWSIVHVVELSWFWGLLKKIFGQYQRDYSFVMTSGIYIINPTVKELSFEQDELSSNTDIAIRLSLRVKGLLKQEMIQH